MSTYFEKINTLIVRGGGGSTRIFLQLPLMAANITFLYDPNMNLKFFNLDVHYFYHFIREELDAQDAWLPSDCQGNECWRSSAAASSASASATLTATAKTFSFRATHCIKHLKSSSRYLARKETQDSRCIKRIIQLDVDQEISLKETQNSLTESK